ncbi:hypothetical protein Dsin_007235 [Dipteronia sinensis]|uniref:non-specific serine/threonine protein kinase n=1 Tax=Dipteronia sinensis TaxID=43782 RepID=A0AAE0B0R4_9ROSI|nr:hypothetical protein Dsin_007235 [Dipteronia sinensis]
MKNSLPFFLLLLLFFSAFADQSKETSFSFEGFEEDDENLTLEGALIMKRSGVLRLTNRSTNVTGHAFYAESIQMFNKTSSPSPNASSFSTSFVFEIVPSGSDSGGHGLAFLLAPSADLPGAEPGHYLGILNSKNDGNPSNHIFFVEFDTVNGFNENANAQGNHVGISTNGMFSLVSEPASYYVNNTNHKEELLLESSQPLQAWIEYDGVQKIVTVTIVSGGMEKPVKPLISLPIDLSQTVKEDMYVGFSASTGADSSSHYILGWSFSLNGLVAPSLNFTNLPRPPKEKHSTADDPKTIALISALCIVTVLLLCIVGCFLFFRRRRNTETLEDWEINSPHRLRYKDLYAATKGFKESEAIGIGGFGAVYKGVLPNDGREIAVKKITRNSLQGMREFAAEIETLGCMRHKNVLNLLGWCKQKNDLLLVYEYMPNGSLDSLLFNTKNGFVLKWEQRLNIIKGIAAGLLYMHEEWEQVVIHRDVKPSNVLIDAEMNARLGDFGLARLYEPGGVSHTTNVVGTIGYIAPEMTRTGKPSTSSDVYAYGVLLLEMVTGRRPTDAGHWLLVDWVRDCQQLGQSLDVIDPLLGSNYVVKEMELVLTLGLICSHHVPEFRPTMRQVMRYLSGDDDLPFVDDWSSADRFQPGSDHENRFMLGLCLDTPQSYPQHWNSLPAGR